MNGLKTYNIKNIKLKIRALCNIFKLHGFIKGTLIILKYLIKTKIYIIFKTKIDIIDDINQILGYEHGNIEKKIKFEKNKLQWVIPDFGAGSGGHLNIFRFMKILSDMGYKNHLVIVGKSNWKSENDVLRAIRNYYLPLNTSVGFGIKGFKPSKFTFATGWQTAYLVKKHKASKKKFYFIQDFEPFFYATSSYSILSENTYNLGLTGITAGTWLKEKINRDYRMICHSLSFSYDKALYKPILKKAKRTFNILFYTRHQSPRRMFEIGLYALNFFAKKYENIEFFFVGGNVDKFKINFKFQDFGVLKLDELPSLYSQCDIALVLSGTNLSLLPLEIAACKCPLIINNDPCSNWLLPKNAAFYSNLDPQSIFKNLEIAYLNKDLRTSVANNAYEFAIKTSWNDEALKLKQIMDKS